MTDSPSLKFFEYSSGTVVCENCLKDDLERTESGEYKDDERVYPGMFSPTETPAQCDGCLTQSDDYDDLLEDEDDDYH